MKAILFDLDGTLIDSLEDLARSCNYALAQSGFPTHTVEEYRYLVGRGVEQLIYDALPSEWQSKATVTVVRTLFDDHYNHHYFDHTKPYEGILELLTSLRAKGMKTALISNKPDHFVKKIIQRMKLEPLLDAAVGQKTGVPRKPDPLAVLGIMDELGVDAADTAYVGDSDVDMKTAKNAGLYAVGVSWGFRTTEELRSSGADAIVQAPAEIEGLIV